jgi:hypothetical protein
LSNNVTIPNAVYVDFKGDPIPSATYPNGVPVGSGAMPVQDLSTTPPTNGAQGVRAFSSRVFDTYFARAVGISSFTATTQATSVTGTITTLCSAGTGCGLFPITVPFQVSTCDNNGTLTPGVGPWPFLGDAQTTPDNEAIVPLCKDKNDDIGGGSAGSVGWLELATAIGATTTGNCANQFKNAIQNPCIVSMPFPTWIKTFTGGVGKGGGGIQDYLNAYHNTVVQIPLFDGTCKKQPGGTALSDCAAGDIGTGTNTWYHVPGFASFKLDYFYIDGNDRKQCDQLPGQPFVSGNGANGCFKGWWVVALPAPGAIDLGSVTPSTTNQLGVQLIK